MMQYAALYLTCYRRFSKCRNRNRVRLVDSGVYSSLCGWRAMKPAMPGTVNAMRPCSGE